MFRVVEVDGGEIQIVDDSGNKVTITQDGSDYLFDVLAKIRNASGSQINPATEETLDSIKDTDGIKKITDSLPAGTNLLGKVQLRNPGDSVDLGDASNPVRVDPTGTTTQPISAASLPLPAGAATEATLSAADTKLGTIDGVLDSIKDTAGIKKITDPLPAGTNIVGKVYITDGAVDVDTVTNNSINRLESRSSVTSPDGVVDAAVSTSATETNRLSVASRLTDGVDWLSSILNNSIRRLEGRSSVTSPDGTVDAAVSTAATETNRLSVASRLTDGVSWISSVLNNGIRRLEGRNSITAPDGSLDVAVITDNSVNRLQTRSSLVGQTAGTGSEKKVSVIDDVEDSNVKRLQTQALLAPGSTVNIGTSIPADPANLTIEFLKTSGGSEDMLVNGSVTPVEFYYQPPSGAVVAVDSILVAFSTDDMYFDGLSFGPNLALTNGIKLQLTIDSSTTDIFLIQRNEDFLRVPGRVPVINNTGPKDLVAVAFSFGGLVKLVQADGDKVSIFIQDDLTSVKFKYFTATIYGAEV